MTASESNRAEGDPFDLARFLKAPAAYMDRTITFDGRDYRVLRPQDKKG